MTKDEIKKAMNIPKRHTLRHYMNLVGKLYGEPDDTLKDYVEEQVVAHEENLDQAIECFQGLIKKEEVKRVVQAEKPKPKKAENKGSRLTPIGVKMTIVK
jgi:hypothetical protein